MKKLKTAGILVVLLVIFLLPGCRKQQAAGSKAAQAPIKVSVSQTSSPASPWQKGGEAFADYLNSKSNGKYEAQVFANASLSQGNYTIMMEQIQSGALQVAVE